jgi:hypothetical protein
MSVQETTPTLPKYAFLRAVMAVLWSFAGLRSRKASEMDAVQLTPFQLIVTGLVMALLLVLGLLALVHWVVQQPTGI